MREMRTPDRLRGGATRAIALAAFAAAVAFGPVSTAWAQRQSGIQLTPDSGRYLISKDVGTDRWAISYNLDDHTVTGNVFPTNGGPPQFVWCSTVSVDQAPNPADAQYNLSCEFAQPCAAAPCSNTAWMIGPPVPVTVAGSFLLPPDTLSTLAGNVQPIYNASCATSLACHNGANSAGGVNLAAGAAHAATFLVSSTEVPAKFYVAPFMPDPSYVVNKVQGTDIVGLRMPLGGAPLPQIQIDVIRRWILEGAANN